MAEATPYVFISHSSRDESLTRQFAAGLQAEDIAVWVDYDGIEAGDRFPQRIESALEGCRAFLLLMSKAARESEWVEGETLRAMQLKRPLFIALLEEVPLPLYLLGRQATICYPEPEAGLKKLIKAIRRSLKQAAPLAPSPDPEDDEEKPIPTQPNARSFFSYLQQRSYRDMSALLAKDLHAWARQHADAVAFAGTRTPVMHVKLRIRPGRMLTLFSVYAYLRTATVMIPMDQIMKFAPYDQVAKRQELLASLEALLPPGESFTPDRAEKRPTLPLAASLSSADQLEAFKSLMMLLREDLRKASSG